MIITQTPFRMSFFGGGTDFPDFYKKYGGAVLSTTFDKYCYVNVRHLPRFFEWSTELTYSSIERVNHIDEIQHPAIREAMRFLNIHELRLVYEADLPARSGLGTSSSFAVGMLNALYALQGKYADKKRLADEAIYLERTLCNEEGGIQDQIAASFGGFNKITFRDNDYDVTPIIIDSRRKELLNENLMLFFTGFSRLSSDIQKETKKSLYSNVNRMLDMLQLVDEAQLILSNQYTSLNEFGRLLDYTWKLKRNISNHISTESIDQLYKTAVDAGAIGGKLLGAGGGGFLLLYAEKEKQKYILKALKSLLYVPFQFENKGTQVLYYNPENYESKN